LKTAFFDRFYAEKNNIVDFHRENKESFSWIFEISNIFRMNFNKNLTKLGTKFQVYVI